MKSFRAKLLFCVFTCCLQAVAASSALGASDAYKRARIAECLNTPAAQLLLLSLDFPLSQVGMTPPVWQTLPSETVDDYEKLNEVTVVSVYDMIITSDSEYAKKLLDRQLLSKISPIFREKIILVGPSGLMQSMPEDDAGETMGKIFDAELLFFSLLTDASVRIAEDELWTGRGIKNPGDNRGYVETGRDEVSALLQVSDEEGFMLVGEASFAQYLELERGEAKLSKFADTGHYRTTSAAFTYNMGFRKERTADAESFLAWFLSPEGKKAVSDFSLGGVTPFAPVE
jgi:ABC-type tungstate transport system permease subunit